MNEPHYIIQGYPPNVKESVEIRFEKIMKSNITKL